MLQQSSKILIIVCGFLLGACQQNAENQDNNEMSQAASSEQQAAGTLLLLVGTYTPEDAQGESRSEGIYVYEMDTESGKLTHRSTATGIANPSYLSVHPGREYVYAVSETGKNDSLSTGMVYAYRFDRQKKSLQQLNAVSSEGTYPCYVSVSPSGSYVATANYGSGHVAVFPVGSGGKLEAASSVVQHEGKGPTPRQKSPHAHMIAPGPGADNPFLYAVDLGIDKVLLYELDTESGQLKKTGHNTPTAAGAGPRHLAFHPKQNWAYVVNEMDGTIGAYQVEEDNGALTHFQTISTLPEGAKEGACADIHVTPSGKYLYASNRGEHNSIAMYGINQQTGELRLLGHQSTKGRTPRNFVIDPSGTFLLVANQNTNNVITFRIDEATGKLSDTGIETKIPMPVCLKFI